MGGMVGADGRIKLKDVKKYLDDKVKVTNKHVQDLAALDKKKVRQTLFCASLFPNYSLSLPKHLIMWFEFLLFVKSTTLKERAKVASKGKAKPRKSMFSSFAKFMGKAAGAASSAKSAPAPDADADADAVAPQASSSSSATPPVDVGTPAPGGDDPQPAPDVPPSDAPPLNPVPVTSSTVDLSQKSTHSLMLDDDDANANSGRSSPQLSRGSDGEPFEHMA